ncbi:MAG: hypothetical protein ACKOL0_01590, partial [Solirubrobacterales bacterium]
SREIALPPGASQVRVQVSPGTSGRADGLTRQENSPEAGTTVLLISRSGMVGVGVMHWSASVNPWQTGIENSLEIPMVEPGGASPFIREPYRVEASAARRIASFIPGHSARTIWSK